MAIDHLVRESTPYLVWFTLFVASCGGVGMLWRKVFRPALEHELLGNIMAIVERIDRRQEREFANGVPPTDPAYIPLRPSFDRHLRWSADQAEKLDAHLESHAATAQLRGTR